MKSVKLTMSAALLGLALGGCGTDNKGTSPNFNDNSGNHGGTTIGTTEEAKRTSVTIDEDLAHQLGLDLQNNCVIAVGDLAKQAIVELHGHACDSAESKKESPFKLSTELAAVKGAGKTQAQGQNQSPTPVIPGKKGGPNLSPSLYYLVLTTTRRTPVATQSPEQGKPTQQQQQGKPIVPPVTPPSQQQGKPTIPSTPTTPSQQQGKPVVQAPVQKAPEQGKVLPQFREVQVTARVGEIVVMPYIHVIPSKAPEQGKVQQQQQQQAPVQKAPEQGKVTQAPVQKAPEQGKVTQAPVQKAPEQGKVIPAPEQGQVAQQGKTGEQGQAAQQTEVLERVVLTKLCTAGKSGASYSGVCEVKVENGRLVSVELLPGQGTEVKGSEKIVTETPAPVAPKGQTQQQQQAPVQKAPEQGKVTQAPVQKAPEQGKVTQAPVQKAPEQGKVTQAPVQKAPEQGKVTQAPVQKAPEQGKVEAPKAPISPAPKQAEQPKQEQRSSQQGPKKAA